MCIKRSKLCTFSPLMLAGDLARAVRAARGGHQPRMSDTGKIFLTLSVAVLAVKLPVSWTPGSLQNGRRGSIGRPTDYSTRSRTRSATASPTMRASVVCDFALADGADEPDVLASEL